jgi:hypothetical protein
VLRSQVNASTGSHFRHLDRLPSLAEFNCGDDSCCRLGASNFEDHRNCIFKLAIPSENPNSPSLEVVGQRIFHGIPFQALGLVALLDRIQLQRRQLLSFGGIQL